MAVKIAALISRQALVCALVLLTLDENDAFFVAATIRPSRPQTLPVSLGSLPVFLSSRAGAPRYRRPHSAISMARSSESEDKQLPLNGELQKNQVTGSKSKVFVLDDSWLGPDYKAKWMFNTFLSSLSRAKAQAILVVLAVQTIMT